MSGAVRHPTVDAVMAIHQEVLSAHGGTPGLSSQALLESAIAAPQASMNGVPMIADPIEMAAAYLFYLCSNHPFVDGNKRVALATCLVFLSENDLLPNEALDVDRWEELIVSVASGQLRRDEVTAKLRDLVS